MRLEQFSPCSEKHDMVHEQRFGLLIANDTEIRETQLMSLRYTGDNLDMIVETRQSSTRRHHQQLNSNRLFAGCRKRIP